MSETQKNTRLYRLLVQYRVKCAEFFACNDSEADIKRDIALDAMHTILKEYDTDE